MAAREGMYMAYNVIVADVSRLVLVCCIKRSALVVFVVSNFRLPDLTLAR